MQYLVSLSWDKLSKIHPVNSLPCSSLRQTSAHFKAGAKRSIVSLHVTPQPGLGLLLVSSLQPSINVRLFTCMFSRGFLQRLNSYGAALKSRELERTENNKKWRPKLHSLIIAFSSCLACHNPTWWPFPLHPASLTGQWQCSVSPPIKMLTLVLECASLEEEVEICSELHAYNDLPSTDPTTKMFLYVMELQQCRLDVISEGHSSSYRPSWSWTAAHRKSEQLWLYLSEENLCDEDFTEPLGKTFQCCTHPLMILFFLVPNLNFPSCNWWALLLTPPSDTALGGLSFLIFLLSTSSNCRLLLNHLLALLLPAQMSPAPSAPLWTSVQCQFIAQTQEAGVKFKGLRWGQLKPWTTLCVKKCAVFQFCWMCTWNAPFAFELSK